MQIEAVLDIANHNVPELAGALKSLITSRRMTPDDEKVRAAATLANLNWREVRLSLQDVEVNPAFRYYTDWNEGVDFGLVAEVAPSETLGAAWLRFSEDRDHGYGFVAIGVPELSISVWEGSRGFGIGTQLLSDLLAEVRRRGVAAISLSVEEGNPARRLYERFGFRPAHHSGYPLASDDILIIRL